jgi:hypothetical protein
MYIYQITDCIDIQLVPIEDYTQMSNVDIGLIRYRIKTFRLIKFHQILDNFGLVTYF